AGAVGEVRESATAVPDLVVELGARPGRTLEPGSELDALHGIDAEDGLGQPAVQLAVPVDVAAQPGRAPGGDDAEGAAEGVAASGCLVDRLDHRGRGRGVGAAHR